MSNLLTQFYRCPATTCACKEGTESSQIVETFFARSLSGVRGVSGDPAELAEDFRRERYVTSDRNWMESTLRVLYYAARPCLGLKSRLPLQRFYVRKRGQPAFPNWPVDTSVEDLCEELMLRACQDSPEGKVPFIWFWPAGAECCIAMTHDVEGRGGLGCCRSLADLDEAFGIRSAFQIVPEGRYAVPNRLLSDLRQRGFEINVHDLNHDGRLFENHAEFERRASRIDRYRQAFGARGFRAASMYRKQDWYDRLHFEYDMSVPNVAHFEPQQGGCCTVMPYFVGSILELPLTTAEDYVLFHILGERSISLWKQQLSLILKKNGFASFLVHPDYIQQKPERTVYIELVSHLNSARAGRNLWFALPGEVNDWWRERTAMELVKQGSSWVVRGRGSERARVAYARIQAGRLVCEVESHGTGKSRAPDEQRVCESRSDCPAGQYA